MKKVTMFVSKLVAVLAVLLVSGVTIAESTDPKQSHRFVVLAPHIVESMYAIGAGHQIVGTTDYADYPVEAQQIPRIGNYARIQIERVIELQPDVIIAWKTGNPPDDLARLQQLGFEVVYSHPEQLEDVASELKMLGQLTGRSQTAEQLATDYLSELDTLKRTYANATPVSVFYELWSRPLRTVAGNAWPQQQVALCGGVNPFIDAAEDYPQIGLESVLEQQPQVIIQPTQHGEPAIDGITWQDYDYLPAVANGFIFHPNSDKVHRMTTRMLDELTLLCTHLQTARDFYAQQDK